MLVPLPWSYLTLLFWWLTLFRGKWVLAPIHRRRAFKWHSVRLDGTNLLSLFTLSGAIIIKHTHTHTHTHTKKHTYRQKHTTHIHHTHTYHTQKTVFGESHWVILLKGDWAKLFWWWTMDGWMDGWMFLIICRALRLLLSELHEGPWILVHVRRISRQKINQEHSLWKGERRSLREKEKDKNYFSK